MLQIIMTARVGKNNLGDIAVDDISLTLGICPSKLYIETQNVQNGAGNIIHDYVQLHPR